MKKNAINILITLLLGFVIYYIYLPPINITSLEFWLYVSFLILIYGFINILFKNNSYKFINNTMINVSIPKQLFASIISVFNFALPA